MLPDGGKDFFRGIQCDAAHEMYVGHAVFYPLHLSALGDDAMAGVDQARQPEPPAHASDAQQ